MLICTNNTGQHVTTPNTELNVNDKVVIKKCCYQYGTEISSGYKIQSIFQFISILCDFSLLHPRQIRPR